MNTTTASFRSISSVRSWLSARPRRTPPRGLDDLLTHYVLAPESPLNSDDDRESVLSIQAKETDYVQDTSDTDSCGSSEGEGVEYEPASEPEERAPGVAGGDTSGDTDSDIITTKVISVGAAGADREASEADSEASEAASDPELGPHDYWRCAQCRAANNNPLYRYCEKCYKVRKNFFPPRPKRKSSAKCIEPTKKEPIYELEAAALTTLAASAVALSQSSSKTSCSVDSGVESAFNSQESAPSVILDSNRSLKRRADSVERPMKRSKVDASCTDSESETETPARLESTRDRTLVVNVRPMVKTLSDPFLTIESVASPAVERARLVTEGERSVSESESARGRGAPVSKKAIMTSLKEKLESPDDGLCIVCCAEPKSGVFVHGRIAHICCCYRCAVKVWMKAKRCPVCNCKVSNVLKAVVM